uniref:Uncharacterized protein LOC111109900 n=1 Tax=Crassostrea virginica TaxID=6565 RepID=A0A8B8BGE2_CRAVI|nr:uncharacterized protein LOC111109900 [Crassostrea virginica]
MTDGGPDHRLTNETVKTSLLLLFLQLDLDALVAIRTAPNNSLVNPAERCMSVLNLALQHSALARDEMNPGFEKMIKHSNSLNAVRNMAQCRQGFREAFLKSMTPVFDIVGKRYERIKLKGEPIEVFYGLKESAMQRLLQIVNEVTRAPKSKVSISATTKELRECKKLQDFLQLHCVSTHYSFQIMKCVGEDLCAYCTMNPPRLPDDVLDGFSFLPCPVPDDSGDHFKTFQEVYGKKVDDSHRPSSKPNINFSEDAWNADKQNRDTLKTQRARDVISCGECGKSRLVYSQSKLTHEQEVSLRRAKEEAAYTCDDDVTIEGLVVRRTI